jgi:putative ABC transport system permease protein
MIWKIAFRNIFRNRRRSIMTIAAVAVGGVASLVFGAYMVYTILGFQTVTVQRVGHLTVFRTGYFDFGAGNPAVYGIADYKKVMAMIADDPVLKPVITVITPTQSVFGIAGNFDNDTTKTFFGVGFIPSDRDRMARWNEYGFAGQPRLTGLTDEDPSRGMIGTGIARILGLCAPLKIASCPPPPKVQTDAAAAASAPNEDFSDLTKRDIAEGGGNAGGVPRIDLLAGTAGGAPNVVSLFVAKAEYQGFKEADESFVGLNLTLAQDLLYGRGEHKVTGIVLQLNRTEDMPAARARLLALFKEHDLDLEARDFTEVTPLYTQVIGLYGSIFTFISVIMGVVVLFTVVNTMSMSVVERTNEIGTIRAMGLRRSGVRRQFLLEGWIIGVLGATAGVIAAAVIAFLVNHGGLTWTPPGSTQPVPLRLAFGSGALVFGTWLGLVVVSTIAATMPASRAARLPVVEALRHV